MLGRRLGGGDVGGGRRDEQAAAEHDRAEQQQGPGRAARPSRISESQCRSRSTRLAATAAARATAAAITRWRPRPGSVRPEDERRRGIEGRRGRGVSARERRAESRRLGDQRWSDAAHQVLDRLHRPLLARRARREGRGRKASGFRLRTSSRPRPGRAQHDDEPDVAEVGDHAQGTRRAGAAVPEAPVGNGTVDVLDEGDAPDEDGEDAEHDATEQRCSQGEGEQQPRRHRAIEAGYDESPQAAPRPHRLADRPCDLPRRPRGTAWEREYQRAARKARDPATGVAAESAMKGMVGSAAAASANTRVSGAAKKETMSVDVARVAEHSRGHPSTHRRDSAQRRPARLPRSDRETGPLGESRLSSLPGEGHPVWTYVLRRSPLVCRDRVYSYRGSARHARPRARSRGSRAATSGSSASSRVTARPG